MYKVNKGGETFLTILEMLDRLEAEILSLRAEKAAVQSTAGPADSEPASKSSQSTRKKHARSGKKKPKRAAAPKRAARPPRDAGEQMALPTDTPGQEEGGPVIGKRRALGRSLLHLRKLAAAARESSSS